MPEVSHCKGAVSGAVGRIEEYYKIKNIRKQKKSSGMASPRNDSKTSKGIAGQQAMPLYIQRRFSLMVKFPLAPLKFTKVKFFIPPFGW